MVYVSPSITPREFLRGLQVRLSELKGALFEACLYDTTQFRNVDYSIAVKALDDADRAISSLRRTASPDTFNTLSTDVVIPDVLIKRLS